MPDQERLEQIVTKAMSRDPAGRYPSAEALRVDLDAFARDHRLDLAPHRIAELMEKIVAAELAVRAAPLPKKKSAAAAGAVASLPNGASITPPTAS